MNKILLSTALLSIFCLAACGGKEEFDVTKNDVSSETNTDVKTNSETKKATGNETETGTNQTGDNNQEGVTWENEVGLIVSSEGNTSDKFSKLEEFMANYNASDEEIEQFKNDIISDYESKRYLGDTENDQYMLSMILKTYIIEQSNGGTPLGDFASIMHENLKLTYLGEEDKESETVKANEAQMDEHFTHLQEG
ncbi:hypothetical protein [Ureibacillus acetophenoni]|uniref:YusW-like protein n=1 Tax=Ureibacillus acetophenoni TaxID=614649 RepID=A0A285URR9_9BACL|nr:hypothetical protein [Ureibacillus acetophenoni]SOC44088.1 hypothetical protein SAMN05877842_1198 [Ureibacillus acetophenoni]